MDASLATYAIVACAALVAEYVDSSLGGGYGTTLTPVLLLLGFGPLQVVPAVLVAEVATGLLGATLHHRVGNVDFRRRSIAARVALVLSLCGLVGGVTSVLVAVGLPARVVGVYIGAMISATGITLLATQGWRARFSWPRVVGVGLVAAFNKGIGGGGYGPLITGGQILSGLDPKASIGVTSLSEGLVSLSGIVAYVVLTGWFDWRLAAALLVGGLISSPLAALTVRRLDVTRLRAAVGVAAIALGALTLARFL